MENCLCEKFQLNNENYSYITVSDFLKTDIEYNVRPVGRTKVLNVGLSFDIETTKVGDYSFMYVWQFAIDKFTVIGRTWKELQLFLDKLSKILDVGEKRKAYVWIHNHSFEFAFYKKELQFDLNKKGFAEIFVLSDRKILTSKINGFIFADSLAITNKPLSKVAVDYKVGISKLNGNLNYNLNISNKTPLKLCQIAYCINDVQILSRWFHSYIVPVFLRKGQKIPLTSTAIVRNDLKRRFKKLDAIYQKNYRNMILRSFPDRKLYEGIMQWLYRGGYVHANAYVTGQQLDICGSADLKSSYPASLLHNKYPYRFISRETSFFDKIKNDRKWQKEKAFFGTFKIKNIRTKTSHTLESKNKLFKFSKDARFDNGRLSSASEIIVCLTEIDWQTYNDFYEFEKVECLQLYTSTKKELPIFIKDLILDYFVKKESLEKDSLDYMLTKYKLNSIYGMMVTGIYDTVLTFDENSGKFTETKKDNDWKELIKNQLLLPYWGIWCTAYSRQAVCKTMIKVGTYDGFYSDTDSIKFQNIFSNWYIFQDYNDRMERLNKTMYVGKYDRKYFMNLGKFDFEGKSYKFMTQGAKRYIHTDISKDKKTGKYKLKNVVTIAGLPKNSLTELAVKKGEDIYNLFCDGMTVSELDSHKMTTKYQDNPIELSSVDYLGNEYIVYIKSCVSLVPIPFKMDVKEDYVEFCKEILLKNKLKVGVRNE